MNDDNFYDKALDVFVRYGFRKASMDNVADAVGLSRQAIYKRYGNKKSLFKAVVYECALAAFTGAQAALKDASLPIYQRFIVACDYAAGQYVEVLRASPHGAEVIAAANIETADQVEDLRKEFHTLCVDTLMAEAVFRDVEDASKTIFVIDLASKGLLHTAKTHQEYLDGIKRVLSTVLPKPQNKKTKS